MKEKAKEIAQLLKVLANEHRLMIVCILISHPLTVGEIAAKISGITQSALSQHLAILKAHRIVKFHKSGQNITYSIGDQRVEEVINVLKKYYCDSNI